MNPSKPITEDQLIGLLKLLAIVGGNPGMLKPVKLVPQTGGYPPKIDPVTIFNYRENFEVIKQLAREFGALK